MPAGDAKQEIPRDKQQQPRQKGKVVRGEKVCRGKAQIGRQKIPVQKARQIAKHQTFKAQGAACAVSKQQEQKKAHCCADSGVHASQQRFKGLHQQHTASDAGEDSKQDAVFGHHQKGDRGNQQTCSKDRQTAPDMAAAHGPAEAGEQNKCPADGLLPEIAGGALIPWDIHTKQIGQVPHSMIGNHVQQGKSPERIQQTQPRFLFDRHKNSFVLLHTDQQRDSGDDTDENGHGGNRAGKAHITAQFLRKARYGRGDGAEGENHERQPDSSVQGQTEPVQRSQQRGDAVTNGQNLDNSSQFRPLQGQLEAGTDHQHGKKGICAGNDAG